MKKYYVYRHRRLDTNEVFYVGIGQTKKFKRAYSKFSRNKWWNHITSKTSYSVEILATNLSPEEACDLEVLLIKEYGRRVNQGGTLVNISEGGDGIRNYKPSKTQGYNHSIRMKGKGNPNYGISMSNKQRKLLSKIRKERKHSAGGNNPNAKLVLDCNTGIFYNCLKNAAHALELNYNTLRSQFRRNSNKTSLIYC